MLLLLTLTTKAAQVAIVISPKALVYADPRLISPIGYIRRGKRIYVGEVKRKRGTILPMVLHHKIVWIRVRDLKLEKEVGSPITRREKIVQDNLANLAKNRGKEVSSSPSRYSLLFKMGHLSSVYFATQNRVPRQGTTYNFHEEEKAGKAFSLLLEYRPPRRKWHWGLGLDYFTVDSLSASYGSIAVQGRISWVPLSFSQVSVEVFGGALFSAEYLIEIKNYKDYTGSMYGVESGLMARLFPQSKYSLAMGWSLLVLYLQGLKDLENPRGGNKLSFEQFYSPQLFAALTYRF